MSNSTPSLKQQFDWRPQPRAWSLVLQLVDDACRANPVIQTLRQRMLSQTGTRLVDWLDHVCLGTEQLSDGELTSVGFWLDESQFAWTHPDGLFPRIVRPAAEGDFPLRGLAIKVDDVDRFLHAQQLPGSAQDQGRPGADLRMVVASRHATHALLAVERHGNWGWVPHEPAADRVRALDAARQRIAARPRPLDDPANGLSSAGQVIAELADQLGQARASELFFAGERAYWQSRNRAARVQFARQDALGLGWANHDHHTYRCSREHFAAAIGLLEKMGFECRERFYAGAEAGWGAQVLEHPVCQLVIFADVDLSPDEVSGDFAHAGLSVRRELGTVGLWCRLHGEAMLRAGLHHLECQFDFDAARSQLAAAGIECMAPFTDFPFLRQAFTEAEQWPVEAGHLDELVRESWITRSQADQFARHGARGSHLEILERNDGYKGFNQTGISEIISRTDPRRAFSPQPTH